MVVTQSYLTLDDPMHCSLPGSSVHGILQARILEWVAICFTMGSSNPGIKPGSPILQANSLPSEPPGSESESHLVVSNSLRLHGLYSSWNSLSQNTGMGSLSLLQGIFPTQESNPGLPDYRWILYQLRHKGSSRILEWVGYPFSSRSSQPRNQTGVSCIAGGFFTN